MRGREPAGIVAPEDADALAREIRAKLLAFEDKGDHDKRPLKDVILLKDVYHGPYLAEAAELQLAFDEGYRVSWQTALLGGLAKGGPICEDNVFPWSGDHCSTDRRLVPGVLLASRRIPPAPEGRPYGVKDVAATVLAQFGLDVSDLDGKPMPVPPGLGALGAEVSDGVERYFSASTSFSTRSAATSLARLGCGTPAPARS